MTNEDALLRLFRCMVPDEQARLVRTALRFLCRRCSLNRRFKHLTPQEVVDEIKRCTVKERIGSCWPASWTGQGCVHMDNLGDPGMWLTNVLDGEWEEILFGSRWNDQNNASSLAESYVEEMIERGVPAPSEFGDDPQYEGWNDEDIGLVKGEFVAFLDRWRENVVQRLEKQCRPMLGPDGGVAP